MKAAPSSITLSPYSSLMLLCMVELPSGLQSLNRLLLWDTTPHANLSRLFSVILVFSSSCVFPRSAPNSWKPYDYWHVNIFIRSAPSSPSWCQCPKWSVHQFLLGLISVSNSPILYSSILLLVRDVFLEISTSDTF